MCAACNGYYSNNCTTCADSNRNSSYPNYVGTCLCYGGTGAYA